MNQWQKKHITRNLSSLVKNIRCNITLLSNLRQYEVLDSAESSKLRLEIGEEEKSCSLLDTLQTRVNGYEHLAKALYNSKQTAALLTLLNGVQDNVTEYGPFAFCGIDVDMEEILSKIVDFEGVHFPLSQVCKSINIEDLHKFIKTNLCATSYKSFISDAVTPFVRKTVPQPLPYYLQRSVYMNNELEVKIFKEIKNDVFLIEDINLHELTQLVRQNIPTFDGIAAAKSSSQIHRPTARFILLEHPDHFYQIAKKTSDNCHWIKHRNGSYYYAKSNSGKGTQKIEKYTAPTRNATISQDVLIDQIINETSNSHVILYDSPGMGKSVILAEIARCIKTLQPQRNVIFLPLTELVRLFEKTKKEYKFVSFLETLLEVTTTSRFSHCMLKALFDQKGHQIELFLDGFDEVHKNDMKNVKMLLVDIISMSKKIRVFIAARLHRANDLEEIFGSLGHKILPFSEDDQIIFFVKYWKTEHNIDTTAEVKKIAKSCLAAFPSTENQITGIPLQCRMLADIFSADAKRGMASCVNSEYRVDSVYKMYKAYMDVKIRSDDNDAEAQLCYDYHTKLAIETLFAETLPVLENESRIDLSKFYKIGILEPSYSDKKAPNFVHQTFAEFFAAEFLITRMSGAHNQEEVEDSVLDLIFGKIMTVDEILIEALVKRRGIGLVVDGNTEKVSSLHQLVIIQFSNLLLANQYVKPSVHFKNAVRESKYFDPMLLGKLLIAALACNAKDVFIFLLDLYLDLDENSIKANLACIDQYAPKMAKPFITYLFSLEGLNNLVLIASIFSSPELVELSYKFLFHMSGEHFDEIQVKVRNPIQYALYRGSYPIVEFLVRFSKIHLELNDIYLCVLGSNKKEPAVIEEKIQILKLLLSEQKHLINEIDLSYDYGVHVDLLKCMIDMGADVTKTNRVKENICHRTADYYSAEEYHRFVVMMIEKGHSKLFKAEMRNGKTPIHRGLDRIDLKSETLNLLSEHCKVNFNNKSTKWGSELAHALRGRRSVRVLKDLIRLGADWENTENFRGKTVLYFSALEDNIEAFKFFLSLGANPNQKSFGPRRTPLSHAIQQSDYKEEFNKILADHAADLNKNKA